MKLNAVAALFATTYAEQLPMMEQSKNEMRLLQEKEIKNPLAGEVIPVEYWVDDDRIALMSDFDSLLHFDRDYKLGLKDKGGVGPRT